MNQINEYIFGHSIQLTESIPLNVYLVRGRKLAIFIDSGINRMHDGLMNILEQSQSELLAVFNTHSHHDHIGGNGKLVTKTACQIIAPKRYAHWHYDWEAHYQEFARPFPHLFLDTKELRKEVINIMDMPHKVDSYCKEGDVWELEEEIQLLCLSFSGHMLSEVGWLETKSATLLLGDVITLLDAPFIHGHLSVQGYYDSLAKLENLLRSDKVQLVLMAHYPPMNTVECLQLIKKARLYISHIAETVIEVLEKGRSQLADIWLETIQILNKQKEFRSLSTIFAHLKDLENKGIVNISPSYQVEYYGGPMDKK